VVELHAAADVAEAVAVVEVVEGLAPPEGGAPETPVRPVVEPVVEEVTEEIVVAAPEPRPAIGEDDLSGLFAALRSEPVSEAVPSPPVRTREEAVPTRPVEPSTAASVAGAVPRPAHGDEGRDRLLLPVQNRALRGVKRQIVDLQNRCLEELRVDETWSPDEALFVGAFTGDLDLLARESLVAGLAAARDAAGATETPHPAGVAVESPAEEFVDALLSAVRSSLERSRTAGSGARETASSLSRVFRTWRTDEAERRVRVASEAAFERGYRAALDALGVAV
jgi:hypothetical protein